MTGQTTAARSHAPARVRVLLYGDVNLNIIDGSAVWLTTMAQTWSAAGAQVDVQLKAAETRDLLSRSLRGIPGVRVLEARPSARQDQMSASRAAQVLQEQDARAPYDVVMVRGIRICRELATRKAFAGRLWCYVTEFGYPDGSTDAFRWDHLAGIAAASQLMLAQTEQARAVLEAKVPAAAGRTEVLLPMVPDDLETAGIVSTSTRTREPRQPETRPLRLVYTGKFARRWHTDRMPELIPALAELGVPAELTIVGDKVQEDPARPHWGEHMRQIMDAGQPGVHWAGARDRDGALGLTAEADVSLGWRDEEMDLSLELSSKVLEACALGVPPVLNRTAAHEDLLGADYPLFLDAAVDGPASIAQRIAAVRPELARLQERVRRVVEPFRVSARAEVLRGWLERTGHGARAESMPAGHAPGRRPVRIVVAGHDLKFAGELVELLRTHPDVELRLDHWRTLHHHDEAASQALVDWADVVMCEWAGPNAVWYARHKRAGQRLVVRLHMFELRGRWLAELDTQAVDRFVTVSEHYRTLVREHLGLSPEHVEVIPNAISVADLDRPGLPGRRHRLGLVGMVPLRKRLDRAVDLLRELHRTDPRYTLHLRGQLPWDYPHEWRKPEQREAYLDLFARLGADPLRHAVAFEPFGADMAGWLRKIGWVLSPSTVESFHLAPAEGMAAGALPVLWERPGAREIFGEDFVVADTQAAAELILQTDADDDARAARQQRSRAAVAGFDERAVAGSWERLLVGSWPGGPASRDAAGPMLG